MQVKNLRSQVSRAAILCVTDLFSCCGRMMDQVILVMPSLITYVTSAKKTAHLLQLFMKQYGHTA